MLIALLFLPSERILFPGTLNISRSESFLASNLSNGCFSLMIVLHIFSRADNSVLDTTLNTKEEETPSFSMVVQMPPTSRLGPASFTTNRYAFSTALVLQAHMLLFRELFDGLPISLHSVAGRSSPQRKACVCSIRKVESPCLGLSNKQKALVACMKLGVW